MKEELRIPTEKQLKAMRVHADKVVERMTKIRAMQIGPHLYSFVKELCLMYQVGHLQFIKPNDPKYDDYWEAIKIATDNSIDDSIWAVWDEGGELLAIVYGCEAFIK